VDEGKPLLRGGEEDGDPLQVRRVVGRGLHSSTFLLNLSRF